MRRRSYGPVTALLLAAAFAASLLSLGCQSDTPGITNKPPPKGGPPANSRRPPGEINNGMTR